MAGLAIILASDQHEKIQMVATLASVASTTGTSVKIFITMNAITVFKKGMSKEERIRGEGAVSKAMVEKGAPFFLDLFMQVRELGDCKIYGCGMAMDLLGLKQEDMEPIFDDVIGATKFFEVAAGSQILVF